MRISPPRCLRGGAFRVRADLGAAVGDVSGLVQAAGLSQMNRHGVLTHSDEDGDLDEAEHHRRAGDRGNSPPTADRDRPAPKPATASAFALDVMAGFSCDSAMRGQSTMVSGVGTVAPFVMVRPRHCVRLQRVCAGSTTWPPPRFAAERDESTRPHVSAPSLMPASWRRSHRGSP